MDFEFITHLQQAHTGIQMLRTRQLPLLASFFWKAFIEKNQRIWLFDLLAERLDDYLFSLRERLGEDVFPRTGREYLDDWSDKQGFLRKYYVESDDVPRIELNAPVEKILGWLETLQGRSFVGTESRLKTIFDLLRSLVLQTETDIDSRVRQLQEQKQAIEQEIQQVLTGDVTVLDDTQIRERFSQVQDTAKALLRDFSEVEQNFRELDQLSRKRIAREDGSRGDVLGDIFSDAETIRESDQGRSFAAFWEFLMSISHQEELDNLLERVCSFDVLVPQAQDRFLPDLKLNLMESADKVMSTHRQLSEQLRRFLDDRARLDNRRISSLIQSIRQQLLQLREAEIAIRNQDWMTLESTRPDIAVPAPYLHPIPLAVSGRQPVIEADETQIGAEVLFRQKAVDESQLARQIRQCLDQSATVSLPEVLEKFPPQQGLAELVGYVKLASEDDMALVDTDRKEQVVIHFMGQEKRITLPYILFTR